MRAFITTLIVLLIAAPSFAETTKKIPTNKCSSPVDTSATLPVGDETDDVYWDLGYTSNAEAAPVAIFFDPDITGAGTGETLTLQACLIAENSNTCWDLDWDSDGDGAVDTNILTGTSAATSGLTNISGFPYLRVQETGTPGANARYVVCRSF